MELDPAVARLVGLVTHRAAQACVLGRFGQLAVVEAVPERVGGRELHRGGELRTAARINRLVDRVARENQLEREHVGRAVGHDERRPVLERVALVGRLGVEGEVGVGPRQALAQTGRHAVGAEVLRTGLPDVVGVVLVRIVGRKGERVGLVAAQPGVGEAEGEGLVVGTVGLGRNREPLVLAHRVGTPGPLLEEVLHREVVEHDAHRTDEGARAPAAGDVELVGGLLLERPVDVHQLVRDGLHVGHDGLGVEVAHRAERTHGLHEQRAVVELARADVEFAADDLVVDALVARDAHLVDGELLALEDLDFKVDGVGSDDDFGRLNLRHQVAVVLVERRDGHGVGVGLLADTQPLVHRLLVVSVALRDAEHVLQEVGLVDRVAYPRDVADVVLVALRDLDVDAQPLVVDEVNRVTHHRGVAVAPRVVEVDEQLLVGGVVLLVELRVAEDVDAPLVGLLEGPAQPLVGELLVAHEVDAADFDLVLAVDDEGDVDALGPHRVVFDAHVDLGVAEALFGPVGLDELLVLVEHVVREFTAAAELELVEQVALLALRDALEAPVVDAGALLKEDLQVEAVALDGGADFHVREEALAPQTRDGVRDEVAGQIDRIAGDEAGRRLEHLLVEVLHAVDVDVADVVAPRGAVLGEHRGILVELGSGRGRRVGGGGGGLGVLLAGEYMGATEQHGCGCEEYGFTEILHLFN